MRRHVTAFGFAIAALSGSGALAQSPRPSFRQELGLELGVSSYTQAGQSEYLTPVSLRYGFYTLEHPWEVQLRVTYSDHKSAAQDRQVRLAAGIDIVRRLSLFPMGGYVLGEAGWTMAGPDIHTRSVRVPSIALGVGRRVLLGSSATFRPEIALQHNFTRADAGATFGAENEVQIRMGLSLLLHANYGM